MKKKSSGKATAKEGPPVPTPAAWLVIHGKVKEGDPLPPPGPDDPPPLPTILEYAVRKFFPEVEKDAPAWAKEAARMALKSAMPPERRRKASEKYLEGLTVGKFSEAKNLLPSDRRPPSPEKYGGLTDEDLALGLPAAERADYFCGFRDGELAVKAMLERRDTLQTVKAYQAIAIHWREAKNCEGNAGELHRWLIEKGAFHYKADPAATRTICRKIGFPTRGKGGHPSQAEQ